MKLRCDVCEKAEASVFCSADEAALCDSCDRLVHHANKLATKHLRFSLLHPKHSPLCDICQERRAFLFCQEDRAILCRECDVPIHRANEQTKKHNRFLLTGVKLSSSTAPPSFHSSSSSSSSCSHANDNNNNNNNSSSTSVERDTTLTSLSSIPRNNSNRNGECDNKCPIPTDNLSEYFDTLPSWEVEDFLHPSEAFWKSYWPLKEDEDVEIKSVGSFLLQDLNLWVPEFQVFSTVDLSHHHFDDRKWSADYDNVFTVPRMNQRVTKKCRH